MTDAEPNLSEPVARSVLSDQVKDRILQRIMNGELAPGSRIIETQIAKDLGVSQAPVREALRDLATLGVIEMQAYRGARVRQPNKAELIEGMELRGELEAIAARQAATRITPQELDALRLLIEEMQLLAKTGNAHDHSQKNIAFHAIVVRSAKNSTLERLWSLLEPYARTYFTAMVPGTDLMWLGDRHGTIIEALEAGDPVRAGDAMKNHAREAEQLIMAMGDSQFGGSTPQTDASL